jgi:hypothetical protein
MPICGLVSFPLDIKDLKIQGFKDSKDSRIQGFKDSKDLKIQRFNPDSYRDRNSKIV